MNRIIVTATLSLFSLSVFGQFKYVPKDVSNAPNWAQEMYEENANLYEVEKLRAEYYKSHAYQKDIHERNFKHWLLNSGKYADERGEIKPPEYWQTNQSTRGGGAIWQPIGPMETYNLGSQGSFPVSWQSNAYCLDVSRSNPNVVVAGIEGGDLFKSTDKGLSWLPVSESLSVSTPTAVRIAPNNENRIYFWANNNLYRSNNGGADWNSVYTNNSNVYEIEVHPTNPDIVFIAGNNGLKRSTDGGQSFQSIYTATCWDVKCHPSNAAIVYLLKNNSAQNKCEFFKSTDGGVNFTIQSSGWYNPANVSEAEDIGAKIGLTAASTSIVYVALIGASKDGDNGWIGVYKSTNEGSGWTNPAGQDGGPYDAATRPNLASFNPDGTGFHQGFYNFAFGVSQIDADRIWVGSLSLSLSTDGGASFERIGGYYTGANDIGWIHPDVQDIVTVGNDVWVTTDGGINYSNDDLATHESRKSGIYNSTFWGYNQGWNQDIMVGGRYHNGNTGYYESYPAGDHLRLGGAESPTGYVNPLLERKVYFSDITDHYLPQDFLSDKLNTGNMSIYPTEGYWTSESSEVEFDPRYASHMYLGRENQIYKSINEGALFEALYAWGTSDIVYEIEVCRQNPDRLYAVVRGGGGSTMYRTTDGGESWTASPTDPGNSSKMEISVDPANDDIVWGIEVNSSTVFRSTNGGVSWEDMTTSTLSGNQLRDVIVQGGSDVVYIASNTSVYYWNESSSDWIDMGAGLPARMDVLEMRIFYKESKLRLADKGKGIWEAPLMEDFSPIAQAMTLNDQVYCSRDTVQFDCFSILNHNGANWSWSFNPQPVYVSSSSDRNPKVVLGADGNYTATLTVTDGNSAISTSEIEVQVNSNCNVDTVPGMALECFSDGDLASTPDFGVTTNAFTVTAWVKPDGIQPDYTGIVMNNGTSGGVNFRGGNNTLGYHWPGGQWWYDSGLIVPENEWSYVAMVVSPTDIKLYLNGVGVTHNVTPGPLDMTSMFIGSYQGWGGRNYAGLIDEVRIWNRSLSQDEIRELRHITLSQQYLDDDSDLLAYYQFNEIEGNILDRKGINHAALAGSAQRSVSGGPFGKGESDRISIQSAGTYSFANTESSITFGSAGDTPDGEVVLSRIHVLPNEMPSSNIDFGSYFVLNSYGSNQTFSAQSLQIKPHNYLEPSASWQIPLYTRPENSDATDWSTNCVANQIVPEGFLFGETCGIGEAFQLIPMSNQFVSAQNQEEVIGVSVYPNPVANDGIVTIENTATSNVRFSLYDSSGKLIRSGNVPMGETFRFEPNTANGLYSYSIRGADFIKNGKLVVVK